MELTYKEKPSGLTGKRVTPIISWWDKDFCCKKMEIMWELKYIGVDESGIVIHKDELVSLDCKDIHEDDIEHTYEPINYCPFCGVAIVYKR